jgi:hypothetical protein
MKWHLLLSSNNFCSSLLAILSIALGSLLPAHRSFAAPPEISQPRRNAESSPATTPSAEQQRGIRQRLTGTWKLTAPKNATVQESEAVWVVFKPSGQDSEMVVYMAGKLKHQQKFTYQVVSLHAVGSSQLVKLKSKLSGSDQTTSFLMLEFHSDRQFKLEYLPESLSTLKFTENMVVATKANNSTNIPAPNSSKKVARQAPEKTALSKLDSILRAQLAYRLNNQSYGNSFQQLAIVNASDDSYRYRMLNVVQNQATVLALPMVKGLRQYIGATYTHPDGKAYNNIICESDRPRNNALDNQAISFPPDTTGRLQCPKNYHLAQF